MKGTLSRLLLGACLILPVTGYAQECAKVKEEQALNVRALQAHLMVAAISCHQQDLYNTLIGQHGKSLAAQGQIVKSYFKRTHPNRTETELNRFITFLANESSKRSLKEDDATFCSSSEKLFKTLNDSKNTAPLFQLASGASYQEVHGISACK